ncbi:RNA polymerase sigma factor [Evansella halocellulosilytica]|uniref:RNA polymerase sigma factor n=1 Tax=Evansella halocellulosilytica TaxID=2011013 RepID=UPI000BB6E87F|nr:sigma-70 family RNA polymerase sigma factor [Evansella halocellulosilytica]
MPGRKEGREIRDEALIKQILQGNDHAFRILIEKYRSLIFKTAYGVLKNEKDAEDAAQEVFIKIYSSLPKYEGKGLKTWMARIAVNHAIDLKRKRDRRKEEVAEDIRLELVTADSKSVESEYLHKEMRSRVRERLNDLPLNYRYVVYGYYIEEKSFQQLSKEEGINEKSVRVKLHRARKWMREHWKEDDFS